MRIHRSKQLTNMWQSMPHEIRRFVESLLINQRPSGAAPIPEWPRRFEILLASYWIIWQIIEGGGETIILVRIEEEE